MATKMFNNIFSPAPGPGHASPASAPSLPPPQPHHPHDITANINYYQSHPSNSPLTKEDFGPIMRLGRGTDARDMTIHDIRNSDEEFSLDRNGFQVEVVPGLVGESKDEESSKKDYEILEGVIKKLTGGSRVRIFNHVIRDTPLNSPLFSQHRLNPTISPPNADNTLTNPTIPNTKNPPRGPSLRPHLDFDSSTCHSFFAQTRPIVRSYINSGRRWQIIGLWRPLKTIQRDPFVLLDARTTRDEDFVRLEREDDGARPAQGLLSGEKRVPPAISIIKYSEDQERRHRWCYLHEQRPEELWVFKHYDSAKEGAGAWRCGHTSVRVPGTMGLPCRESIEFRAMVFY